MTTNNISFTNMYSNEAIEYIVNNLRPGELQIWRDEDCGRGEQLRLITCFEKVYDNMIFKIRDDNLLIFDSICWDISIPDADEGFGAYEVEELLQKGNCVIVLTNAAKNQKEVLYDFSKNKIYENTNSKIMTNAHIITHKIYDLSEIISDEEIIDRIQYAISKKHN